MSDTADTIATAICLAAGRMAHGSSDVDYVTSQLAEALRPFFTLRTPTPEPVRPVSDVDTPAQHIEWAIGLVKTLPAQFTATQSETLHHLRRAAELIAANDDGYSVDEFHEDERHNHTMGGLLYEHAHRDGHDRHDSTPEHLRAYRTSTPPEARPEPPRPVSGDRRALVGALRTLAEEVDDGITIEDGNVLREAADLIAGTPQRPATIGPVLGGILTRAARDYAADRRVLAAMALDGWQIIPPDTDERFSDYGTGREQ